MSFIEPQLDVIKENLATMDPNQEPLWGSMSAQRMIEHLSDALLLCRTNHPYKLAIPEEKVERAQGFLASEHPMPRNFKVEFATPEIALRFDSMEEAIAEFGKRWNEFESHFKENPGSRTLHPNFGMLDFNQWLRLHSKHVTHHLSQFGVGE